jgi:uncharacterized damage-inducible protein DinB
MGLATSPLGIIHRLHDHRRWFRGKMLESCRALSTEDQRRAFAMGPGSIFAILAHDYFAETAWISAIDGSDPAVVPRKPEEFGSLDELLKEWERTSARWDAFLAAVRESDLPRPVVRVREGKSYTTTLEDVLIHVAMHQMYHAAQFKNMLRQLGVTDIPVSDFIVFARETYALTSGGE